MRMFHGNTPWGTAVIAIVLISAGLTPGLAGAVDLTVLEGSAERTIVQYALSTPTMNEIQINGEKFVELTLGTESLTKEVGAPAVPKVCRSLIVADNGQVAARVLKADYYEVPDIGIAPSKGFISRAIDPADVPYIFGAAYSQNAFYPGQVAALRDPYILRDYRGVVLVVNPYQYNPVSRTLRVYTDIVVEVTTQGTGGINELDPATRSGQLDSSFKTIYEHQFINYPPVGLRYDPLDEDGDMLIICHDAWLANIQPLADHRSARGIPTTVVAVSTVGNNSTSIKNYIQNVYNTSDLAYVLLVGDGAQVASPGISGADPTYAKLAGADDYPEILVGRFSAETATHVDTQVQRTIEYETMPAPLQDWFWKGTGIASAQGAGQGDEGQADYVHMDEIRDWLLAFGYTEVDQIYDTNGGTAAMVTAALNDGRGIINYCGHGSTTSWSTTGFSNSDVAALTNRGKLPFIISVACVNGNFIGQTCFAEAWLRSTSNSQPVGAIATYMSSINQSWAPPMEAQDEFNLLLCAEAYISYGALCFAGSCSMMDDYGSGGVAMFDTWHIFGDPALRITITCTDEGTISMDSPKYACDDTISVLVVDCGLNLDDQVADTVTINVASDSDPTGISVLLTELGPASGQFEGTLNIADGAPPQDVLLVAAGDTITATYADADDGTGSPATVLATALVDCTPPVISNVQVT
ncbi:MAG: C25 family cysteine peptidase, partial [Planctomycetota bacterium]